MVSSDSPRPGRRTLARRLAGALGRTGLGFFLAVALLALVEGVLRLVLGPSPPPLMVRTVWDFSMPLFEVRNDFVFPLFQRSDAIPPFPLRSRPGRPRVLCVGGSTVRAGSRLPAVQEFPAVLEGLLHERGVQAEVINLGRPVFDSGGVREVVEQAMMLEPDAVISFQGHNDIGNLTFLSLYGDLGSATAARVRAALYRFHLFHLLERLAASTNRQVAPFPHDERHPNRAVERARIVMAEVLYRQNLDQTVRIAHAGGAEAVLVTIVGDDVATPSMPSCPDLVPEDAGVLEPNGWHLGMEVPALTLDNVEAGLRVRPDCADLLYLQGQLLFPRDPRAAEAFRRARDLDPFPIRATTDIVQATREVAEERGAVLVDFDAIARREGQGVPPREWFVDPVHLSREGHLQLARALAGPVETVLREASTSSR